MRGGHINPVTGALNHIVFVEANRRYMQTEQHCGIVVIKLTNLEQYSRLFSGPIPEPEILCYLRKEQER